MSVKKVLLYIDGSLEKQRVFLLAPTGDAALNINGTAIHPANIYMFKVNNRNTRTRCEIYSKLTIKTPERRHSPLF